MRTRNLLPKSKGKGEGMIPYKQIPANIKTSTKDLVMGVKEINGRIGDTLYLVICDNDGDVVTLGANCIKDVIFYADRFKVLDKDMLKETTILKVRIEDPEDLPYEISDTESVYVIFDDWELMQFDSMKKAVDHIEENFIIHTEAEIDMFTVMIGRESLPGIQKAFIKKLERKILADQVEE